MDEQAKRIPGDIKPLVSDRVLFAAVAGLFTVAILVSGGFSAIYSAVKKQGAVGRSVQTSCPPCEEAKRERDRAALNNQAKTVEDAAETESPDSGG